MTTKPFPLLCKDCKHSIPEKNSEWMNGCTNSKVVSKNSWALANNFEGQPNYVHCREEREKKWFTAPCGIHGKLWEANNS